ncbi:telomeric repeat-binding factor 1 [Exaiptasia diaphana]|uniref:Telomeric repeat-binding factor n=1 Tax=Exaiptasia diaphana TaxID=2652724 RepID=A0A913Y4G2_EXADI|nr:telomeric repeat-binding factor 1 [Exaiptasia diaphana]
MAGNVDKQERHLEELEKLKKELILDFSSHKLWKEFKRGSKMSNEFLLILRDLFIRNQNLECSEELQKKLHCTRFICGLSESKIMHDDGHIEVSSLHTSCLAHAQGICRLYPFALAEQQHFQCIVKLQIILTTFTNGKMKKAQELFNSFYDEKSSQEEEYQEELRELLNSENENLQKQILEKYPYNKFLREVISFLKPALEKYESPFLEKFEESMNSECNDRTSHSILKIYHDHVMCTSVEESESSWDSIINENHPDIKAFKKRKFPLKTKEPKQNNTPNTRKTKDSSSTSNQKNTDSERNTSTDDNESDENTEERTKQDKNIEEKTKQVLSKLKTSSKDLNDHVQSRMKLSSKRSPFNKKRWNQHQDDAESITWSDSDEDNIPSITAGLPSPKRCLNISLPKPPKRRKKNPWTEEELSWLCKGVDIYGEGNWAKILRMYSFRFRTSVDLKDKWRNFSKTF